jgi:hypothetical protein
MKILERRDIKNYVPKTKYMGNFTSVNKNSEEDEFHNFVESLRYDNSVYNEEVMYGKLA